MTRELSTSGEPAPSLCSRWGLRDPQFISHRNNMHWHVRSGHRAAILRCYGQNVTKRDIDYEMRFSDHLVAAGWPVPAMLEAPEFLEGRWWALFEFLPGEPLSCPDEHRLRGRLLAEFHETTRAFPTLPRQTMPPVREVIFDPQLGDAVRFIERHFPEQGRIMSWHLAVARERFMDGDESVTDLMIHGDFNSRNLLFVGERLSGILDFEASHPDCRVADFALSWRGNRDEVVLGYDEVAPLSGLDWRMLAPCMWGWAFYGVVAEVERMKRGEVELHGFDWPVKMLLRRTPLMGPDAVPYPG